MARHLLHDLVDYIYSRPPGTLSQELGGIGVTLLALAATAGVSADAEEKKEIARVLSKPVEYFTQRNKIKDEAGFRIEANSLREVQPQEPSNPSCHVCGSMMVPIGYKCWSCGASTLPTEAKETTIQEQLTNPSPLSLSDKKHIIAESQKEELGPTDEQVRQARAREWLAKQPRCCSYPECDGNLVGEEHAKCCPLYGRPAGTSSLPTSKLLAAYGAEVELRVSRDYQQELFHTETQLNHWKQRAESAEACLLQMQNAAIDLEQQLATARTEAVQDERQRCLTLTRQAFANSCSTSAILLGMRIAQAIEADAPAGESSEVQTMNAPQKGEKFRIVKVNMNCFKIYLFGHFIGSMNSEASALIREKSIADHINRYIDREVRLRLPDAIESKIKSERDKTIREIQKWMRTAALSANGDIYYSHLQSKLESMLSKETK